VPALVDADVFEAARAQLAANRRRKRDDIRGPRRWLLQGLTVCHRCGYAYYGRTAAPKKADRSRREYRYYRCPGTEGHRFGGTAVCDNRPIRGDHLEQAVWERVRALLEAPGRLADEYHRRLHEAQNTAAAPSEVAQLERQIAVLQRGIGRLIDSYAAGVIDRAEFEPRIGGLKARAAQLRERQRAAAEAAAAERELTLVIGRLEDFAAKVRDGLDTLDWHARQEVTRSLVRRVEIDGEQVEIVFRVPPPSGGRDPQRQGPGNGPRAWQDCMSEARGASRRAGLSAARLRAPHPRWAGSPAWLRPRPGTRRAKRSTSPR
jgi:site-specific DNA recombinase